MISVVLYDYSDMWQYNVSSDTTHLLTDGSNLHC